MAVYKDKKRGTWYFSVFIKNSKGENKRYVRRGFESRPQAIKAEAKFISEFEVEDEENPSFKFIAEEYLKWYKRRRKESSYSKISSIVNIHLIPRFEKKKLKDIRNRDITRMQNNLLDEEYAVSHVKKIHQTLSAIFNFAIKEEYTSVNPARIVGNIDLEEEKHIDYWTLEEFKRFISVVDDLMYRTLFMTLYYSGMRKGELLALNWSDINFENNTINIYETAYNRKITTTKTTASTRKILMPKHVMRLLMRLKNECKPKPDYVVFGEYKDHIATTTLDRRFESYVTASGVKKIRIHDFRHSHASYLINRDTIISVIAQRLGHKDIATTLNTYSHLYPTTEREAVLKMENDFKTAEVIDFKVVKK